MHILIQSDWNKLKREPYQKYDDYNHRIQAGNKSILASEKLKDPEFVKSKSTTGIMMGVNRLAQAGLELTIYSYSGGIPIK